MNNEEILLIKAGKDNYDDYYKIRSEDKNLYWTGYKNPPDYCKFREWFNTRLDEKDRDIFLLFEENKCVGSLHIDYYVDYAAIGYSIREAFEGRGYGTFIVKKAKELIKLNTKAGKNICVIKAWINSKNIGSVKVVEKNGFIRSSNDRYKERFGKKELFYEYELRI